MTLDKNDAELFYELWLPLLDYVNKKYKVNTNLENITGAQKLEPGEVKIVAAHVWEHISVID